MVTTVSTVLLFGRVLTNTMLKNAVCEANSKKVIFFGDSHILYLVNDKIYSEFRNFGAKSEPFYYTYYRLSAMYEKGLDAETIVLGIGYHSLSSYYDSYITGAKSSELLTGYFYLLPSRQIYSIAKGIDNSVIDMARRLFFNNLNNIFSRSYWNERYDNKFINTSMEETVVKRRISEQFINDSIEYKFSGLNRIYLDSIAELCSQNKSDLYLLSTPVHDAYRSNIPEQYILYLDELVDTLGIAFIDYSDELRSGESFTPDGDHVSMNGSDSVSAKLHALFKDTLLY